jgi:large subunit ribosomal protein L14
MLSVGSLVKVSDNSGGKIAKCIRVLGKDFGYSGDLVIVSIREVLPGTRSKVEKGEVHAAVVVRTKKGRIRDCGSWVSFDDNAVVLVSKKGQPIGSRVLGPIAREVREAGYKKIVSLAMLTI